MLTFLTGCDAGAKRDHILRALESAAQAEREAWLLVPDQEAFERERELLLRCGAQTANRIRVTGFLHFSVRVLENAGLPVRPAADEAACAVFMSLALQEVADGLEIYAGHYRRPGNVQSLLSAYDSLRQAGEDPAGLEALCPRLHGRLRQKTQELSRIFAAYDALLTPRFSTANDNLARAVKAVTAEGAFAENAVFFFDDFRGFTGLQQRFIAALCSRYDVCVSLTGAAPSGPEGPAFAHAEKNRRQLTRAAIAAGARVFSKDVPARETPLAPLRRRLFALSGGDAPAPGTVTVIRAQNRYDECAWVAQKAQELLASGFCRAGEIAVLIRDDAYRAALSSALRKAGVPVFEDRRQPLAASPLARLLSSAVRLAAEGFDTGEVLAWLKTDLTGVEEEDRAELENYVFRWQIDGKRWEAPFTGHPDGFGAEETSASAEALARINGIRERVTAPILKLRRILRGGDAVEGCRALYTMLRELEADRHYLAYAEYLYEHGDEPGALDCGRVWDLCMQALDALAAAAGGRQVRPSYFYELLTLVLSGTGLGEIPPGTDQVRIGTADRTRFLSPRAVFAVGFCDGVYPAPGGGGPVFTGRDLRQLYANGVDLEGLPEDVYEEERLLVYGILTGAEERVYVSRPAFTTGGDRLEPSPFLEDLRKAAPSLLLRDTAAIPAAERVCSEDSALEAYADALGRDPKAAASLRSALLRRGLDGRLQALDRAVAGVDERFRDPAVALRLFGSALYLSASKVETYAKCPFLYFCRYGMGLEKPMPSRIDARIHGLLVHKVLEDMLRLHPGRELAELPDARLREEIRASVDDYAAASLGGREQLPPALGRTLRRIEDDIREILLRLRSELQNGSFLPVKTELQIGGKDCDVPAYELPLPDGGKILLTGSIDRVDMMETEDRKYVRVVDYKTGGKKFRLADVFDGLNMQMLLYLFALCRNGTDRYGRLTPAGILYVPANNAGEKLGRHSDEEAVLRQKLKNGRMNGLLLEDPAVIRGMETAAEGKYINAWIGEDGALHGDLLSGAEFRRLHDKTDGILRELGLRLHGGDVPALPIEPDGARDVCQYCDFAAVCQKERDCERRSRSGLTDEAARNALAGEPDDGGQTEKEAEENHG